MKSDPALKSDVEAELKWVPNIDESHIGVVVNKGVVTLSGTVRTYLEKYDAERAIKRLSGVAGVANEIEVRLATDAMRPDSEIAENIARGLRTELPPGTVIKVMVDQGRVTLEGTVEWHFQRQSAEHIARRQKGVSFVLNLIFVEPKVQPRDIKRRIQSAFHRHAQIDADHITVVTDGGVVTLRGSVPTWTEREEAQETAWQAPGVTEVRNEIAIGI